MKYLFPQLFHTVIKIILILAIAIGVALNFPNQVIVSGGGVLIFKPIGYLLLLGSWIVPNYYLLVNKIFAYRNIFYLICINILIGLIIYFSNAGFVSLTVFVICGIIIVYYFMGMIRKNLTTRLGFLPRNTLQDIFISIFIVISTAFFSFGIVIIPAIAIIPVFMIFERKKLFGEIDGNAIKKKYIFGEFFIASITLSIFQLVTVTGFFLFMPFT